MTIGGYEPPPIGGDDPSYRSSDRPPATVGGGSPPTVHAIGGVVVLSLCVARLVFLRTSLVSCVLWACVSRRREPLTPACIRPLPWLSPWRPVSY